MKLISWNVNGIRSVLRHGFLKFFEKERPDVLCLQETKARPEWVDLKLAGYEPYWNSSPARPHYSGTATFSNVKPRAVTYGIGLPEHDAEGRVITCEYGDFYLVNVYVPNSKRDLSRLDYRTRKWDPAFLAYLKKLEKKKSVVFCGDLNVAHEEIDLTNPKSNRKNHGFTEEERAGFDALMRSGFLDTFREFTKGGGHYTWWSRLNGCRQRNIGWRIDYFCISKSLRPRLEDSYLLDEVDGSDHCPIVLILN